MVFDSDEVRIDTQAQVLTSDRPVTLRQGLDQVVAGGLRYDHGVQRVELRGPVRGRLGGAGP